MKKVIFILLGLVSTSAFSQMDSSLKPITISAYIENYFTYDLGKPANNTRPPFVYSYNRHNEVNLNLGFVKAAYVTNQVRANLALMTGTYVNANLAAEPGVLKNIFEGNAGVKISKNKNLWLDAGIFPSHIGFESAIGKDCWNLTRSIMADNTPYYESGAKISFTTNNEKWFLSGLVLNGWQRIQRMEGNSAAAFGHQIAFKPNARITLNSSSFVGSDTPDSTKRMRYFHNFFGQFQIHQKVGFILGFDIGWQQKSKGSNAFNNWYTPILIVKYTPTENFSISGRGEYYSDLNQVIITTGTINGFQTMGYSMNLDYCIAKNMVWRIEGRTFNSKDQIFTSNKNPSSNNYFVTTAFAISF